MSYLYSVPINEQNDRVHFCRPIAEPFRLDLISIGSPVLYDQPIQIYSFQWLNPKLICEHLLNRRSRMHSFVKSIVKRYCTMVSIFWTTFHFVNHIQRWNSVLAHSILLSRRTHTILRAWLHWAMLWNRDVEFEDRRAICAVTNAKLATGTVSAFHHHTRGFCKMNWNFIRILKMKNEQKNQFERTFRHQTQAKS